MALPVREKPRENEFNQMFLYVELPSSTITICTPRNILVRYIKIKSAFGVFVIIIGASTARCRV